MLVNVSYKNERTKFVNAQNVMILKIPWWQSSIVKVATGFLKKIFERLLSLPQKGREK